MRTRHEVGTMNILFQKYRDRRDAQRRARAIERALDRCPSRTVRDELFTISTRY